MRTISAQRITEAVAALCIQANTHLPADVEAALRAARASEPWPLAKTTLGFLCDNLDAAGQANLPICQDTGMACVFVELGTDVHIEGDFEAAIHEGVRRGYTDGYLRKSIAADQNEGGSNSDVRVTDFDGVNRTITVEKRNGKNTDIIVAIKDVLNDNGWTWTVVSVNGNDWTVKAIDRNSNNNAELSFTVIVK